MKVVIFCGGKGLRLRDYSETIPKPMVPVGPRPIVWHTMKYYAHHGHKEFILALGHKADSIKTFFLEYSEAMSNDFVLTDGGRTLKLLSSDIDDWKITFVDTGIDSNIGQRLLRVRPHLNQEDMFMCSYADCLTDAPLTDMINKFEQSDKLMSFIAVKPSSSFHALQYDSNGDLTGLKPADQLGLYINGGYWIMRPSIFDYIKPGEEVVEQPMQRLIDANKLTAYRYDGFWACMDTFKEKMMLDDMVNNGSAKWQVWANRERRRQ
ncbi:glucose-1-phosphate cytidylyltransferase [Rhodopseudomonas palustris]|uniref:Glucose-1-phosphate cytidylyltransferase n=1 Tax=Rhodopseudomonas palustris TaxID=1076 RepID=A0AAX3DUT3_RHOPL|nr:sugar phosphate nucleotidyltransferase [Rhodopseudomonas palustris]UYO38489.1 glucose-1-phosphate cytidylyltransferase [Rhodopseudomonas palustris]